MKLDLVIKAVLKSCGSGLDKEMQNYLTHIIEECFTAVECDEDSGRQGQVLTALEESLGPFLAEYQVDFKNDLKPQLIEFLHDNEVVPTPAAATHLVNHKLAQPMRLGQSEEVKCASSETTSSLPPAPLEPKGKKKKKSRSKTKNKLRAVGVGDGHGIEACSQLNRFHEATLDHQSKDIHLVGVTISVGGFEVLVDAELKIEQGCHYGLIGRNGVGKSTLLRAIGDGLLEGISSTLRILYVDQLEIVEDQSDQTVVEAVLAADREVMRVQHQVRRIENSMALNCAQHLVSTLYAIRLEDLERELMVKRQIANKRSGARGSKARAQ